MSGDEFVNRIVLLEAGFLRCPRDSNDARKRGRTVAPEQD